MERLLTAIYFCRELAVIYCKGHSRNGSNVAEANQFADCQTRKAAMYEDPSAQMPLIWPGPVEQKKQRNNILSKH